MGLVSIQGGTDKTWRQIDTTFALKDSDYQNLLRKCNKVQTNIDVSKLELISGNVYYDASNNYTIKVLTHKNELNNIREIIITDKLSQLCPTNIVNFYGYAKVKSRYYLIMERISGKSLLEYIIDANSDQLFNVIEKVIDCLYELWSQCKFTHYDLHISNIIVTDNHIPKIIDFGHSYIQINDKHLGYIKEGSSASGRSSFICQCRSFWMHDLFKLLSSIYLLINPNYIINRAKDNKQKVTSDIINEYIRKHDKYLNFYDDHDIKAILEDLNNNSLNTRWYQVNLEFKRVFKKSEHMKIVQLRFRNFLNDVMIFFNPNFSLAWLNSYRNIFYHLQVRPTQANINTDFKKFMDHWSALKIRL